MLLIRGNIDLNGFKEWQQGRARIPWGELARPSDVVAFEARDRNGRKFFDTDRTCEFAVFRDDVVKGRFVVTDKIHLVHGKNDVTNADQVHQIAMATSLGQHAFARVDQNNGEVGG